MSAWLWPLLQLQRFYVPLLLLTTLWCTWRVVFRGDLAVGLAFYLGLIIIVDGYYNTGLFLPGMEKGSIRWSEVCAAFLLLRRPPAAVSTPAGVRLFVGIYFLLLFASVFRAQPLMAGVFEFRRVAVPQMTALLLAIRGFPEVADFRRFFLAFTALVLFIATFVFWDVFFDRWLLHSEQLFKPEYWLNRKHGRFGGMFLNPNLLGAFVVLVFPVTFVFTLVERRPWLRVYGWAGLLAQAFCLVETQSRGPLLALAASVPMLVMGPGGGISRRRRLALFGLLLAAFTAVMPGFYEHAVERFDSLDAEAATDKRSRESTWLFTAKIIADHPLAGIGFGEAQFVRAMERYDFAAIYGEESLDNPHNSYLQIAAYAGLPALAAFVLANLLLLWGALRAIVRQHGDGTSHIAFAFATGLLAFLASIYPDRHLFAENDGPVFWAFFGLLFALSSRTA